MPLVLLLFFPFFLFFLLQATVFSHLLISQIQVCTQIFSPPLYPARSTFFPLSTSISPSIGPPPHMPEIFNHHFLAMVSELCYSYHAVPATGRKMHYLTHFRNDFTVRHDKKAWGYKQTLKCSKIRET